MAAKLWSKGYDVAPEIERYGAARNAALDATLARHDVWGSLAHARTLRRAGLLSESVWQAIDDGLLALLTEAERGTLVPSVEEEDIHTLIERRLVERIGSPGKQLHLGRSRNDQVLVDLRLYAKEALPAVTLRALEVAEHLLALAREHEWTPMPGYTHMQRAMLSSVGLWASAHAEALLEDCVALDAAYALNDQCPLGSGAAYGVPLPLDRAYTAVLLGFAGAQHNVLAAANSRGKGEAAVTQALGLVMLDLSKWAQDLLLFTTAEFGLFVAPRELCDGSSIMPQKLNLSTLELVRARAQTVIALQGQILVTLAGLPSGYNMDYQETKTPFMEALAITCESLEVANLFAQRLQVDCERMLAACTAELFATDHAYELARTGTPFRDAYREVAAEPDAQEPGDLVARLRARASLGAPGNLQLARLGSRIEGERAKWESRQQALAQALRALASGATLEPTESAFPQGTPSMPERLTFDHVALNSAAATITPALGI
jgi:argininosuccinate lyase